MRERHPESVASITSVLTLNVTTAVKIMMVGRKHVRVCHHSNSDPLPRKQWVVTRQDERISANQARMLREAPSAFVELCGMLLNFEDLTSYKIRSVSILNRL